MFRLLSELMPPRRNGAQRGGRGSKARAARSKDLPVNVIAERAAKAELQSHSTNRIEFYAEHLDAMRFPGESYYKLFRKYLREKYAQRPP